MALTFRAVNPLDHREQLKRLFLAGGVATYPAFIDRAYPPAVAAGAASWIGETDGRLVMHMARFNHRFVHGESVLTGGLLVNLMVDNAHREFFPAVSLARTAVAESRRDGGIDFLYTNPNAGGLAIVRAAGLNIVSGLRRFILPLGPGVTPRDLAARAYRRFRKTVTSVPSVGLKRWAAKEFDVGMVEKPHRSEFVTAIHPADWYRMWLPGYPAVDADFWFTHQQGATLLAALFVRIEDRVAKLLTFRRRPGIRLGSLLWSIADQVAALGARHLQIWTLTESPLSIELREAGFFPRRDIQPFLILPLTPAGAAAARALPKWEITDFDCDR